MVGGTVAGLGFVIELGFLAGAARIADYHHHALVRYD
jgi:adenine/guanine phosphoribosyltransferase-like PRPP-binding protein